MKIVFLSHLDKNLYLFRLPIMRELVKSGHKVYALCPSGEVSDNFSKYNIEHIPYKIVRNSLNPLMELATIKELNRILNRLKPDILHAFTHKPNIYGALAYSNNFIQTVTGLGSFYVRDDFKAKVIRLLINNLYRLSSFRASYTVFQNSDDLNLFVSKRITPKSKSILIKSSGVDIDTFKPREPDTKLAKRYGIDLRLPTVLMVARVIKEKGVDEYIKASNAIKKEANFLYIGDIDKGNLSAYSPNWGKVKYLGYQSNISSWLSIANLVVLPSYREGVPRTLLEAMAMGKAIVTTNSVGCREVIRDKVNGLMVPPRDAKALAKAIESLIAEPKRLKQMGEAGRKIAVDEFSSKVVTKKYLELYKQLVGNK